MEASGVGQKGKLTPNWEGPYKVQGLRGPGAYKLATLEGIEVLRTWHTVKPQNLLSLGLLSI